MKKYWMVLVLAGTMLTTACEDEGTIAPRNDNPFESAFGFPEGNDPWDQTVLDIHERFGVYLIYKNLDSMNINRHWTLSPGLSYFKGRGLQPAEAEFQVGFMKNHIFDYLNTDITAGLFKPFYLLVYNVHHLDYIGRKVYTANFFDGRDSWISSIFNDETEDQKGPVLSPERTRERRVKIIRHILEKALEAGNIQRLPGFEDLFDWRTFVWSADSYGNDPDYFVTRGFLGEIEQDNYELSNFASWSLNTAGQFKAYFFSCLRYTDEELRLRYPHGDMTLMNQVRRKIEDYYRSTYNLDLEAIRTGPQ